MAISYYWQCDDVIDLFFLNLQTLRLQHFIYILSLLRTHWRARISAVITSHELQPLQQTQSTGKLIIG